MADKSTLFSFMLPDNLKKRLNRIKDKNSLTSITKIIIMAVDEYLKARGF